MSVPQRSRSELESFVLGLAWQHGPCSSYQIRRILMDSPSRQWSGSAGAIYPLVRRLEQDGLLSGTARAGSAGGGRAYSITAKGRAALRRWIGPPIDPEAWTVTSDPLRSRLRFLAALAPAERTAWVRAAESALDEVASSVELWTRTYASGGDPLLALVARHGELDVAFRRAWLKEVAEAIGRGP